MSASAEVSESDRRWIARPTAIVLLPAALCLILSLLPTLLGFRPEPAIQDEFAHLLAADTFTHGRLTNRPHSFWTFFESVHILQQPTYASKFLPGQGLCLALGELLGQPIDGVCLCAAAAVAAIAWMMLGCLPPRWALIGGLLAAIDPLILYWADNYWGGEVPLLGGALLCGAAVRIARFEQFPMRWGVLAGIGGSILLISRPFEGGITALLIGGSLLVGAFRRGQARRMLRLLQPMLAVVFLAAIWLGYYDWRVTGRAWQLPYTLHASQYMMAPLMFWQPVPPQPQYRHVVLWHFYQFYEWPEYAVQLTPRGFLETALLKLFQLQAAYLRRWYLMVLPWLLSLALLRCVAVARFAWIVVLGLPLLHMALTPWFRNQYMAPAMSAFLLLIVLGLRQLWQWRIQRVPMGAVLVGALLLLQVVQTAQAIAGFCDLRPSELGQVRRRLIDGLARQPGKQLVFVRHSAHGYMSDIVYNGADIDLAQTVFAHDMGDTENRKLIDYYAGRTVWLINMDDLHLGRYQPTTQPVFTQLPRAYGPS